MTHNHKLAYNDLLYHAMLEIRGLQSFRWRSHWWNAFYLSYWRTELKRIRYGSALADALHNLAFFSSYDYDYANFNEDWFWRDMEILNRQDPTALARYRKLFEQKLAQLEYGASSTPDA